MGMKLSIVIPAFNEETRIVDCLKSISEQTVEPDEVIVVDNNCTDRTLELARQFGFVTIVKEPHQGRAHARNAGFKAASSDIIGRIDADSQLDSKWVENVKKHFEADNDLAGLTGLGKTAILPYINFIRVTLFSRAYFWFVHAQFRTITMWGANMAVRKSAWMKVKPDAVTEDSEIHEDQDLSLCMMAAGAKIVQVSDVLITTNGQEYRYLPKLLKYNKMFRNTKMLHTQNGNLASNSHKLALLPLALGYICSVALGLYLSLLAIIFFPLDYVLLRARLLSKRLS